MLPPISLELIQILFLASLFMVGLLTTVILSRRGIVYIKKKSKQRLNDQAERLIYKFIQNKKAESEIIDWLERAPQSRLKALVNTVKQIKSDFPEIKKDLNSPALRASLKKILHSSRRKWARARAAWAIGKLGFKQNIPVLKDALDDSLKDVGYSSAQALGDLNTVKSGEILAGQIGNESYFRNSWIASILEIMDIEKNKIILGMINSSDPAKILWGIRLIGSCQLFDLVEELKIHIESKDPDIRSATAQSIGLLKVPLTDRWLEPSLYDEKWFVQVKAAEAVGKMESEWAVPALAEMLTSEHWWLRHNATEALIRIGEPSVEAMENVLLNSEDKFARRSAVSVLERTEWVLNQLNQAQMGNKRSLEALYKFASRGGIGCLENILMTASQKNIPLLLDILEKVGDDATFGRIRAAAEQMPEHLRNEALTVARSFR